MNSEEVECVEKCYEVSKSNISLEENSCLQAPMTKFKLKRSGDKWFAEVTGRAPCAKKQAKEVTNPNSSPKENAAGFRTRSSQKIEKMRPRPYSSRLVKREKRNNIGGTKKSLNNRDLHRSLFSPNGLQDGTKLAYFVGGKVVLEGYKKGDGIVCSECDSQISPSDFEAHAKYSKRRQPYKYIRTANGQTLHEIAMRLSEGRGIQSIMSSTDVCLGLEGVPTGNRHSSHSTENIVPDRRDPSPVISQPDRVVKQPVVKPPVYQPSGCVLCRDQDFTVDAFDELKIMQCYQCGRQYHVTCLLGTGLYDLEELYKDKWFCCNDCNNIHSTMQGLLLPENKVLIAPVLEKHIGKGVTDGTLNSMHYKILSGTSRSTDSRLLSKAAAIFKESFKTIKSKTCPDVIAAAIHGKNISDQESRQIYCVVLVVDSVVSSAGVLRIISKEIAELPVVATRRKYRRKGYFRVLLSCIEQLLLSMNVEKIVLPAAEVAESMWINNLGFKKISDEQLSEYTKIFQLTMFTETPMLEKVLSGANYTSKVGQTTSQLADSSRISLMEEVRPVAE